MARFSRKEFAEKCSMPPKTLEVYISRGKVICSGKFIDDTNLANADFVKKHLEKAKAKLKEEFDSGKMDEVREEVFIEKPVPQKSFLPNINTKSESKFTKYDYEKEKAALVNEKLSEEVEILKEKKQRIQGVTIPKEPVVLAFRFNFKNFSRTIKSAIENLVTRYEKNFTPEQFAAIRSDIVKEINHAQTIAVAQSKKNIAEIISMVMDKKEKGERE